MAQGPTSEGNVILVGFMGAGKSSVGARLAALLGMAHLDTDALIEAEAGATISEIFGTRGEAWFRRLEAGLVRRVARLGNTVISVGGGTLMSERNVHELRRAGVLVWLRVSPEGVIARLHGGRAHERGGNGAVTRPLLPGAASIEQVRSLMSSREPRYRLAQLTVDTDGKTPDEIARELARELGRGDSAGPAGSVEGRNARGQGGSMEGTRSSDTGGRVTPGKTTKRVSTEGNGDQDAPFVGPARLAELGGGPHRVGSGRPDRADPCWLEITAGTTAYPYALGHGLLADPDTYRAAFAGPVCLGSSSGPGSSPPRSSASGSWSSAEPGPRSTIGPSMDPNARARAGASALRPDKVPDRVIIVTTPLLRLLFGMRLEEGLRGWLGDAHFNQLIVWAMVPDGEKAKTISTLASLYNSAAASGMGRDSLVVALGGGTVGDVAGFFAGTYMRGIRLLQIPTTLLAMVDSSIGGKAAINLRSAKNLAGVFWQPAAVIADTATLETLPIRDIRSGLAEVIKAAVIGDPILFEILERLAGMTGSAARPRESRSSALAAAPTPRQDPALWREVIRRAAMVKAKIVATDERDAGARLLLNLGHTLGHAVEQVGGFRRWSHGEAVAIGLAAACRASVRLGLLAADESARVINVLAALGLPTALPAIGRPVASSALERPAEGGGAFRASVLSTMALDKKARGGKLRVVLPLAIGKCAVFDGQAARALEREIP